MYDFVTIFTLHVSNNCYIPVIFCFISSLKNAEIKYKKKSNQKVLALCEIRKF